MRDLSGIIDVHSHAILHIGQEAPMDKQPDWSVDGALATMDRHGITACVLSVPDAANAASGSKARDIARRVNEALAQIVSDHPTRFAALATLPGGDADGALLEIEHALGFLEMDGVATSTSINDVYLGEPVYDPWFDELNRRKAALFVHPVAAKASSAVSMGLNVSVLEFMFDTTRCLTNLVLTGAKKRFSDVSIISTHGGGTIPYLMERIQVLESAFGAGAHRTRQSSEEIKEGFSSFYYDLTAATSRAQLSGLRGLVTSSRLMMGFDIPFMPPTSYDVAISEVLAFESFDEADLAKVSHENAATLFPALAARITGKA